MFYYLLCRITVSTRGFGILNSDVYLHSVINTLTIDPEKAMCKGTEKYHAKIRDHAFHSQTWPIAQLVSTGKKYPWFITAQRPHAITLTNISTTESFP